MGIASLVLGIISVSFIFIPCLTYIAMITCVVGFVLGLIDLVKKKQTGEPKGQAIAGVVLNAIPLAFIVLVVIYVVCFSLFTI